MLARTDGCSDLARNEMPRNEMPRNEMPRNDMPRNDMPRNEMPRNEMPRNGLTSAALNTNHELLQTLASHPFQQALDDLIANNLIPRASNEDPAFTRKLLKYIAACALDPCDHASSGNATNTIDLEGELGLCGETYNTWVRADPAHRPTTERSWKTSAPSEGCKQRVSACVLARVNAAGASVRISMRGDGLNLKKQVSVDTMFHENHGTRIQSFESCAKRSMTSDDARRNCDWAPRHVGRCVTGAVTVRASGRIRVCAGVYGCDDPVNHDLTPLFDSMTGAERPSPPPYGGAMLAHDASSVTFQCPANGPVIDGRQTGYFAVMVDAGAERHVDVSQAADPLAEYPASEAATFTYREGAFYGDLFAARAPEKSRTQILSNDQYACFSNAWTSNGAVLKDRLCTNMAGTGECFGNTPGPCEDGRCRPSQDDPRVEGSCYARQPVFSGLSRAFEPYTVYLNHPCERAADYDRCLTLFRMTAPRPASSLTAQTP